MTWFVMTVAAASPMSVHADHIARPPVVPPVHRLPPPPDVPAPERIVYGYYASWAGDLEDLQWERLTHVAVFNVDLRSDGTVSGTSTWNSLGPRAVALGAPYGVKVHLALTCFDATVMRSVLSSASRRATLVSTLGAAVDSAGAHGVSVDCEGVPSDLRDYLTDLVVELKARVDEVTVATPAVDWSDAFDKAALTRVSDGVFIMGYDYHWSGSDPGPTAPLHGGGVWSRWSLADTVSTYLAEGADPERIILGLPLYGRSWPTTSNTVPGTATASGSSVVYTTGQDLFARYGRLYDVTTDTPYTFQSSTNQTWVDDAGSLEAKIHFAITSGLGGIGFWALNYEGGDPDFWDMVTRETTGLTPEEVIEDTGGAVVVDSGEPDEPTDDTTPAPEDTGDAAEPSVFEEVFEPLGRRLSSKGTGCAGGFPVLLLFGLGTLRRRRAASVPPKQR